MYKGDLGSARIPETPIGLVLGAMVGSLVGFGREDARRQREEDDEDFKEFSELWEDSKSDSTGMVRRFRRS